MLARLPRPERTGSGPGIVRGPASGAADCENRLRRFSREDCIYKLVAGKPVGSVRVGERFVVETTNAFGRAFANAADLEAFMQSDGRVGRGHPCTGPIHVVGVTSDASIVIDIERVITANAMSCLSTSTGFLRGVFPNRQARAFAADPDGFAHFPDVLLRGAPSIGTLATLDAVERSAGRSCENGGNMDVPYLRAGCRISLPVNHESAEFAVGDLHFRQGFGEAPGMGIEADGEILVSVAAVEKIPFPVLENTELVAIVGWGATLAAAAECAVKNAITYLKRLEPFASWSEGTLYQLLGGFDLALGNATGRVATCAQTLEKRALLDPVSRRSVVLGPLSFSDGREPASVIARADVDATPTRVDSVQALVAAVRDFDDLEVVHDGASRQIRLLPGDPGRVISVLKPNVYSYRTKGTRVVPGTELVRAEINAVLSHVLKKGGVSTTTLATRGAHVLMRRVNAASSIEVVLKTRFVGSPKHRYKTLSRVLTRAGGTLSVGARHDPYVRFDWRNGPPQEDEVLPEWLANQFIDVAVARHTVLAAHRILQSYLAPRDIELVDGCFFMSDDGRSICGEISPDNLTLLYTGRSAELLTLFLDKSKERVLERWSALGRAITGS